MENDRDKEEAGFSREKTDISEKNPGPGGGVVSPDGGYGWVVMVASFMINFIVDGVIFTFGIFYVEFSGYFRESKSKTAWVGSVLIGVSLCMGPAAGALTEKYGCRLSTITGSILAAAAFILASFSPNIDILTLIYGGLGGVGFGLMYLPSIVIVGYYFDKKRAFATGVAVCGSGLGVFAFAPLFEFLIRCYTWKGALWILSGITLNGVVAGALYRPLNISVTSGKGLPVSRTTDYASEPFLEHRSERERTLNAQRGVALIFVSIVSLIKEIFSLLKHPAFLLYGLSCLFCMNGFLVPYNYLPGYAVGLGIPAARAALIMSVIGIIHTLTMVVCGWVSDRTWADCLVIYNGALVMGGVATLLCPLFNNFGLLCLYACAFGVTLGVFTSLRSIIMVDLFGLETLAKSFGLVVFCQGVVSFIGPPLAGYIFDMTGSYRFSFYMAGILLVLAGLLCFPLRRVKSSQARRLRIITGRFEQSPPVNEHLAAVSKETPMN